MIIYKVTNKQNGKIYIGLSCKTLELRRAKHEYDAMRQDRKTVKFHNALLKYGFNSFDWEVVKECESQDELDYFEEFYISKFNSLDKDYGYNLKHGGKLGGCYSQESKIHMGEATKRKWQNPECAEKMKLGLEKGRETIKQNSILKAQVHICPVCHKTFYTANWNSHTYCSQKCANESAIQLEISLKNLDKANNVNKENYAIKKSEKYTLIVEWVRKNSDILKDVKWNNLKFISSLCDYIGVKDHRTVAKFLDVSNKKELVQELIKINENLC